MILHRLAVPLKSFGRHPLTRKRRAEAIFRFFTWQIYSRLKKGDGVHEWIDGSKFYVRAGETGLTQNIYTGLHEFEDMGFLLHFVRAGDLFVDVGANVGSYTILACAARGARGYAFEPIPATFVRLMSNMHLNKIESQVECLNIGVGSERGVIQFTSRLDTINHALPPGSSEPGAVSVEVLSLDEILADESPALMKIDVEGFEAPVIKGAENTMKKETLHAVIMELNGSGKRYGWDETHIVEKMMAFGFSPYSYDPLSRTILSLQGKNADSGNTLFLRNESYVLDRIRSAPLVSVNRRQF